mmetsp:Transcript_722/g.1516  ORF Transcript_722/g.1516 Transcript_722/m.1516 type:complete len:236 (-) Transcript_722:65-772(-)
MAELQTVRLKTAGFPGLEKGDFGLGVDANDALPIPRDVIAALLEEASATINGSASARQAVKLPKNIDKNEWLGAQMVEVYQEAVSVVKVAKMFCRCEKMSVGKYTFAWRDIKTGTMEEVSAVDYMSNVVRYSYELLTDTTLLPRDPQVPYPAHFEKEMVKICRWIMRVYSHVYVEHLDVFKTHGAHAHLNYCFKHFVFLVVEFSLLEEKDFILKDFTDEILQADGSAPPVTKEQM